MYVRTVYTYAYAKFLATITRTTLASVHLSYIHMSSKRMTSISVTDLHATVMNLSMNNNISVSTNNKNMNITSKYTKIFDIKYIKMEQIGRGGFSCVYKCKNRITDVIYAVKIIDLRPLRLKDNFDSNHFRREVDIMKNLQHVNIVQFIEYFETLDEFYIVLEYCPGRELFDVILEKQCLSETMTRPIFLQVCLLVYIYNLIPFMVSILLFYIPLMV